MIDAGELARLALFSDLRGPQLQAFAQQLEEQSFPRNARVLREGISGNGFYVVTAGEAAVRIGGTERARLRAGDFFGEVSILTGEPPGADVVAVSEELRCAVLDASELRPLLLQHPAVALRMLEADARRLRDANLWAG